MTVPTVELPLPPGVGSRMRARAHVATELRPTPHGQERSRVSALHSEAPLVLRIARAKAPEPWAAGRSDVVRVALTAGAAGPVGGDELDLTIDVGAGSSLVLSEISPTLLLPGPHGERSRTRVRVRVAAGATLIWLAEPMIAARGCDHLNDVGVQLEEGARLLMREEILLGRHAEVSGRVGQRISVRLAGRPLYRQDLHIGSPEAATPSVIGDHRAVGSMLIVDPDWAADPPTAHVLDTDSAVLPLEGPAALITALAGDNLAMRHQLAAGLTLLGEPWAPPHTHTRHGPVASSEGAQP